MAKHGKIIVKPPRKIKIVPGPAAGGSAPRKIGIVTGKAKARLARALPKKARGAIRVGGAPRGAERRFKPGLPKRAAPPKKAKVVRPPRLEKPIRKKPIRKTAVAKGNGGAGKIVGKVKLASNVKFG